MHSAGRRHQSLTALHLLFRQNLLLGPNFLFKLGALLRGFSLRVRLVRHINRSHRLHDWSIKMLNFCALLRTCRLNFLRPLLLHL